MNTSSIRTSKTVCSKSGEGARVVEQETESHAGSSGSTSEWDGLENRKSQQWGAREQCTMLADSDCSPEQQAGRSHIEKSRALDCIGYSLQTVQALCSDSSVWCIARGFARRLEDCKMRSVGKELKSIHSQHLNSDRDSHCHT